MKNKFDMNLWIDFKDKNWVYQIKATKSIHNQKDVIYFSYSVSYLVTEYLIWLFNILIDYRISNLVI